MNTNEFIILNFEEVRRRSIKVWKAIPQKMLNWKPDSDAMTCAEMIRHIVESEFLYHQILVAGGSKAIKAFTNPFENRAFTTVDDELEFIKPYREDFLAYIRSTSNDDLKNVNIDRSDVGYIRTLGDMLLRIAYHESVHTGQILDYMRTMGVDRPMIWD